MDSDILLMIPYLSEELNLIGYPKLPYSIKKSTKTFLQSKDQKKSYRVIFDSKVMISALACTCFNLVKQIKMSSNDDSALDVIDFKNNRLQKQLKASQLEIDKMKVDLNAKEQANVILQNKISELEKELKLCKTEHQKAVIKSQTNENLLKHALKKKESNVIELNKTIWKKFNMVDKNCFPQNYEFVQLDKPDFHQLWSTVQYSDPQTKEDALKKAVAIFQEMNTAIKEENFSLKTLLLNFVQEIQEILILAVDKMQIPSSLLFDCDKLQVLNKLETFSENICDKVYKNFFCVIKQICALFDQAQFSVGDEIFVCWSNILKDLRFEYDKN